MIGLRRVVEETVLWAKLLDKARLFWNQDCSEAT